MKPYILFFSFITLVTNLSAQEEFIEEINKSNRFYKFIQEPIEIEHALKLREIQNINIVLDYSETKFENLTDQDIDFLNSKKFSFSKRIKRYYNASFPKKRLKLDSTSSYTLKFKFNRVRKINSASVRSEVIITLSRGDKNYLTIFSDMKIIGFFFRHSYRILMDGYGKTLTLSNNWTKREIRRLKKGKS